MLCSTKERQFKLYFSIFSIFLRILISLARTPGALACASPKSLGQGLAWLSGGQTSVLTSSHLFIPNWVFAAYLLLSHFSYLSSLIKWFSGSACFNWIMPPISPTLCTKTLPVASCWCTAFHLYPTPVNYLTSSNTPGARST